MDTFTRVGHEGVRFFVGPEIEQTPAFGRRTLFVVGLQDTGLVERLADEHRTTHIFLSANRSFDSLELVDGQYKVGNTLASDWEVQMSRLLNKGFIVSLEYPAHKHVDVLKVFGPGIWQSRNFIPVLSVAIPHVNTSNVNLTIKIDDSNFKATNPGVWCMNHQEVTDSNRFTSWNEYGDDLILTEADIAPFVSEPDSPVHTRVMKSIPLPPVVVKASIPNMALLQPFERELLKEPGSAPVLDSEKNDGSLGLDVVSTSNLKPETLEEKEQNKIPEVATTQEAIDAYSEVIPPASDEKVEAKKKPATKKVAE